MADRFALTFLTAGMEADQALVATWLGQQRGQVPARLLVANDSDLAFFAGFGTSSARQLSTQHGGLAAAAPANHVGSAAGRIRLTTSLNGPCFVSNNNNTLNAQRYEAGQRAAQGRILLREPHLALARTAHIAAQVRAS